MKMKKLFVNIIVLSFIFDIVIRPIPNGEVWRIILVFTHSVSFIFALLYYKVELKGNIWILLTLFYFLLLTPFSNNIPLTVNYYLKFTVSLLMFYFGIKLYRVRLDQHFLSATNKIIYIAVIYVLYSNLFDFGTSIYRGQEIKSGFLEAPFFYAPALSLVLYTFLDKLYRNKLMDNIFITFLILYFILLFRRTIYVIIIIGFLIPILRGYNLKKHLNKIIALFLVLTITFPLYQNTLQTSLDARGQKTYSDFESISKSENRIVEYLFVYNIISNNIVGLLFGSGELFNSAGNYNFNLDKTRPLHSDYSRLLFGGGFLGLFFYFMIFIKIFYENIKAHNKKLKKEKTVIYILIALCFVTGFTGNITFITFKAYLMIVLGIYYARLKNMSLNNTTAPLIKVYSSSNG